MLSDPLGKKKGLSFFLIYSKTDISLLKKHLQVPQSVHNQAGGCKMTLWGLKCHSLADAACLARPKSTVDEVSWNRGKPPAGLDQTPLVAGAAH